MDCAAKSEDCLDVINVKFEPHLFSPAVNYILYI